MKEVLNTLVNNFSISTFTDIRIYDFLVLTKILYGEYSFSTNFKEPPRILLRSTCQKIVL